MTREERLSRILAEFDRQAEEFCRESNGLTCEIRSVYKKMGAKDPQNLKHRLARVSFHTFAVEFKYTAHSLLNASQSILECLVYPDKECHEVPIPLPMVLDYCDVDTANPLCIPMIFSPEAMKEAFASLTDALREHRQTMESSFAGEESGQAVYQAFFGELTELFGIPEEEEERQFYLNDALYDLFTIRFSADPFLSFIRGDRERAIRRLGKVKKPTGYEKRVLRLWQADKTPSPALSQIQRIAASYTKSGTPKQSGKELFVFFLSWLILTVILLPLYGGFYLLLRLLEGRDSLYLMSSLANVAYSFLFAFLTAIAASYFLRFRLYRRIYPKDFERYCEIDHMQNGSGSDRLMKVLLHGIVIAAIAGTALLAKWNINFLENGFVDNTKFLSLKGEYHAYEEVDSVYYKPNRVNGLGEVIEFPSYVLVLKDGTEIDFYQYEDISEHGDALFRLFREKGIPVDESQKA